MPRLSEEIIARRRVLESAIKEIATADKSDADIARYEASLERLKQIDNVFKQTDLKIEDALILANRLAERLGRQKDRTEIQDAHLLILKEQRNELRFILQKPRDLTIEDQQLEDVLGIVLEAEKLLDRHPIPPSVSELQNAIKINQTDISKTADMSAGLPYLKKLSSSLETKLNQRKSEDIFLVEQLHREVLKLSHSNNPSKSKLGLSLLETISDFKKRVDSAIPPTNQEVSQFVANLKQELSTKIPRSLVSTFKEKLLSIKSDKVSKVLEAADNLEQSYSKPQ